MEGASPLLINQPVGKGLLTTSLRDSVAGGTRNTRFQMAKVHGQTSFHQNRPL